MRLLSLCLITLFVIGFSPACTFSAMAQQLRAVKWPEVKSLLQEKNDSADSAFWATWCRPWVTELLHFEKTRKELSGKNRLRLRYISLDFAADKFSVEAFVSRKLPGAGVWLLDETEHNKWIHQLDEKWSGVLPATLVFHPFTNNWIFAEGEINEEKLRSLIKKVNPY
jgi:hypothetical protein